MQRDPECGMDLNKDKAIRKKIGDRTYYFCSQSCADVYEQPEQENHDEDKLEPFLGSSTTP